MEEDKPQDRQLLKLDKWKASAKRLPRVPILVAALGTLAIAGLTVYAFNQVRQASTPQATPTVAPPVEEAISAIGRLEPEGEVIKISGPSAFQSARVGQLLVKEGDRISKDGVIAIMDNFQTLSADLEKARQEVKLARAELTRVRAGAEVGEISAQRAKIAGSQAELSGQRSIQQATVDRLIADLAGQQRALTANIANLKAELRGQQQAQTAKIAELSAQLEGEQKTRGAEIARLSTQLEGEQKTQQATINRLSAQLRNAETEWRRYQQLYEQGAVSASTFDSKRLAVETTQEELKEAQENRDKTVTTLQQQIREVRANLSKTSTTLPEQIREARANRDRTVTTLQEQINETQANLDRTVATLEQQINETQANRDRSIATLQEQVKSERGTLESLENPNPPEVSEASAKVQSAIASLKKAQANLNEQAYVRSPVNGQVLKIHAKSGENIGSDGIVELGQTDRMMVTAEVYESDISKVKVGQKATIVSDSNAFEGEIQGTVSQVGLQIGKKDALSTDPAADVDARVVEVKIRLDPADSDRVAALTNSKVIVKILI
ncbi:MAG: HlyD family efflux transporter periplasmic adaptor subunit [Cyanosarcina radialis HA8281-LM2]|nr:HlyD family efflux transporter periplasmic adaptor subunit [Cyanosarcina radialis HA8281-LM2]